MDNTTDDTKGGILQGSPGSEYFIQKLRELNGGLLKTYRVNTYGCQMNAHDSEKLAGLLSAMGYSPASGEEADLYVFNTCCVRENAENRLFGNLGALKRAREDGRAFKAVVCGCMPQRPGAAKKLRKSYKTADVIFGTFNMRKFPELLYTNIMTGEPVIDIWDGRENDFYELDSLRESKFSVSVNIMYGCDNFCSYCVVPYVRGRERSRPEADILEEIRAAAAGGAVEALLLGQNVNSYGGGGDSFARLLERIAGIDGIRRLRFMTSHPKDLSGELISAMRDLPQVCPALHLPFQSGSTRVLELMNRKYTKESYLALAQKIRENIPDVALTTDIIAGFPTETEADFADTLDVVGKARFLNAYTFIYSRREGTPAAELSGQIPPEVSSERFSRLCEKVRESAERESGRFVGRRLSVLADSFDEKTGVLTGRTQHGAITHIENAPDLTGRFADVLITESKTYYLLGKIAE
ncbi:MAG: tRNA (N6-isopentenyl adenosine(37)-C2)-methylthiotransferase MiaB [Clostridiales bacterium]|jgi:tRNA-2-methylthio-N6-dimethylallyladenosine synthase|nr:tRNA (N6-isopentenyl adenosine(37)-C2)-methylthiotransferase MiaB [Clostridiales bacterium]